MDLISQQILQATAAGGKAPVSWTANNALYFTQYGHPNNIAYNPSTGTRVVALPGNVYATSSNGTSWSIKTLDINFTYDQYSYQMSEYSSDGNIIGSRQSVTFINNKFVMTLNASIFSSSNGTSWTYEGKFDSTSAKTNGHIVSITWDGTYYWAYATPNTPNISSSNYYYTKKSTTLAGISAATASSWYTGYSGYSGGFFYTIDANKHIFGLGNNIDYSTDALSNVSIYYTTNYPNYGVGAYKAFACQNSHLVCCASGTVWVADSTLGSWTYITPISSSYSVLSGAYTSTVGGTYGTTVYACSSGKIYSTTDQVGWWNGSCYNPTLTERPTNTTNDVVSVEWSGDKFIAFTTALECLTSADGITWTNNGTISSSATAITTTSTSTSDNIETKRIAYSSTLKKYVWVKGSTTASVSTDGITWSNATLPQAASYIEWTGTVFVAAGTYIMTSPDGTTWTQRQSISTGARSIASNGATVIVTNTTPVLRRYYSSITNDNEYTVTYWKSIDSGATWAQSSFYLFLHNKVLPTGGAPVVEYDSAASLFYMITTQGTTNTSQMLSSADGTTWRQTPFYNYIDSSFTVGSYTYLLMGGVIYKTNDGVNYTVAYNTKEVYHANSNGTNIVFTCTDSTAYYTTDFSTVNQISTSILEFEVLGKVSYVNSKWFIHTTTGNCSYYSSDLTTWYYQPRNVTRIVYCSSIGKYIATAAIPRLSNTYMTDGPYLRLLVYSSDGINWVPFYYTATSTTTIIDIENINGDLLLAETTGTNLTFKKFTNNAGVPSTPTTTSITASSVSTNGRLAANSTRVIFMGTFGSAVQIKHAAISDLATWSDDTSSPTINMFDYYSNTAMLCWNGTAFVCGNSYNTTGMPGNWTVVGTGKNLGYVTYDTATSTYYAIQHTGSGIRGVYSSTDQTSWTLHHVWSTASETITAKSLAVNNGNFVIGGNTFLRYKTSAQTTYTDVQTSYVINRVIYANSKFVAVGNSGQIYVSANGSTWSTFSKNSRTLRDVAFTTSNNWVIAGDTYNNQTAFTISTDNGVTWTDSALIESRNVLSICADSSTRFYAAFAGGEIVYGSSSLGPWNSTLTTITPQTVTSSAAYYTGSYNNYIFGCTAGYVYANLNGTNISSTLGGGTYDVVNVTIDGTNAYATLTNSTVYKYDAGSWALSSTLSAKVNELLDPNYAATPGSKFYALVNPNKIATGTTSANLAVYTTASLDNGVTYNTSQQQQQSPVTTIIGAMYGSNYNPSYGGTPLDNTVYIMDLRFSTLADAQSFATAMNSTRAVQFSNFFDNVGGVRGFGAINLVPGRTCSAISQQGQYLGGGQFAMNYYVRFMTSAFDPTNYNSTFYIGPQYTYPASPTTTSWMMMQTVTTQTAVDPIYPTLASAPSTWNTTTASMTLLRTAQQTPVYEMLSYIAGSGKTTGYLYCSTEFNTASTYYLRLSSTSTVSKNGSKGIDITNATAASSYTGSMTSNYPSVYFTASSMQDTGTPDLNSTSGHAFNTGTYTLTITFSSAGVASAWKNALGRYGASVQFNTGFQAPTQFNCWISRTNITSISVSGAVLTVVGTSNGWNYQPSGYGQYPSFTMGMSTTKNTFTGATADAPVTTTVNSPYISSSGNNGYFSGSWTFNFGDYNNQYAFTRLIRSYAFQSKYAAIADTVAYGYSNPSTSQTTWTNAASLPVVFTYTSGGTNYTATLDANAAGGYSLSQYQWASGGNFNNYQPWLTITPNSTGPAGSIPITIAKPKKWSLDIASGFTYNQASAYVDLKFPSITAGDLPATLFYTYNSLSGGNYVWLEVIQNNVKTVYYGIINSIQPNMSGYCRISFNTTYDYGSITQANSNDTDMFAYTTSTICLNGGVFLQRVSTFSNLTGTIASSSTGQVQATFYGPSGANQQTTDHLLASFYNGTLGKAAGITFIDRSVTYQRILKSTADVAYPSGNANIYGYQYINLAYTSNTASTRTSTGFNTAETTYGYVKFDINGMFPAATTSAASDLEIATGKTFNAMVASGSNLVAVGNAGSIYTSSDQGLNWSAATLGTSTTNNFIDVVLDSSGNYVWAVTNLGEVYYASTGSLSSWSTTGANGTFGTGGSGAITARGIANTGGNIYSYGNAGTIVGTTSSATSGWTNYNMTKPAVSFVSIASLGAGADSGGYKTMLLGSSGGYIAKTTVAAPTTATDFTFNTFYTNSTYYWVVPGSSNWYVYWYDSNSSYTQQVSQFSNAGSNSYSSVSLPTMATSWSTYGSTYITVANGNVYGTYYTSPYMLWSVATNSLTPTVRNIGQAIQYNSLGLTAGTSYCTVYNKPYVFTYDVYNKSLSAITDINSMSANAWPAIQKIGTNVFLLGDNIYKSSNLSTWSTVKSKPSSWTYAIKGAGPAISGVVNGTTLVYPGYANGIYATIHSGTDANTSTWYFIGKTIATANQGNDAASNSSYIAHTLHTSYGSRTGISASSYFYANTTTAFAVHPYADMEYYSPGIGNIYSIASNGTNILIQGGNSLVNVSTPSSRTTISSSISDIKYNSARTRFEAVSSSGTTAGFLYSTSGTASWSTATTIFNQGTTAELLISSTVGQTHNSVHSINSTTLIASGRGTISKSTDSGATWSPVMNYGTSTYMVTHPRYILNKYRFIAGVGSTGPQILYKGDTLFNIRPELIIESGQTTAVRSPWTRLIYSPVHESYILMYTDAWYTNKTLTGDWTRQKFFGGGVRYINGNFTTRDQLIASSTETLYIHTNTISPYSSMIFKAS